MQQAQFEKKNRPIIIFSLTAFFVIMTGLIQSFPVSALADTTLDVDTFLSGSDPEVSSVQSTSTGTQQSTALTDDPAPPEDVLSCSLRLGSELIIANNQPLRIDCNLTKEAIVSAKIIKGEYDAAKNTGGELVKYIAYRQVFSGFSGSAKALYYTWNGLDQFDNTATDGEYIFVVMASVSGSTVADISTKKFQLYTNAPIVTQQTELSTQQQNTPGAGPTQPIMPAEEVVPGQEETALQAPPVENLPVESQCPGVKYPVDINGHWAETHIKKAYDECIVRGYSNNLFVPQRSITRAEALKTVMLAAGIKPKLGCYTDDCGSPYDDLESWQGQWVRAAWDSHIISANDDSLFRPNERIKRSEAAVLVARAFGIQAHQGCYTANCGAGHPDNFFVDIREFWLGPYLRALWDEGIITGTAPGLFEPTIPMTRAEFVGLSMKTRALKPAGS